MVPTSVRTALASGLGLGLSPVAPGTCGTLMGVVIHVGIVLCLPAELHCVFLVSAFLLACVASRFLAPWAQAHWHHSDPRPFVLDEVAGYLLVPILFRGGELWPTVLLGFLGFRFFDIVKVPPAWQIDKKLSGPWGILLDDLVSAVYAALSLYALQWATACFSAGAG